MNHAMAVAGTGRHPGAVRALAAVTMTADQNRMDTEVSVRESRRVMMSLNALTSAPVTGIRSAHSKDAPPGRMTITTPAKPPMIASQRFGPTRSPRMGTDRAAMKAGETNMIVITVASG